MKCVFSFVLLLTLGCSNSFESLRAGKNGNEKPGPGAIDLSGKSLEEILQIKYTKALLKCALWIQYKELDIKLPAIETYTWDLKSGEKAPEAFSIKHKINNYTVEFNFKFKKFYKVDGLVLNEQGKKYTLKFTPHIEMSYSTLRVLSLPDGDVTARESTENYHVSEKIPSPVVKEVIPAPDVLHTYAHCLIDTDIKPDYADQFKVE